MAKGRNQIEKRILFCFLPQAFVLFCFAFVFRLCSLREGDSRAREALYSYKVSDGGVDGQAIEKASSHRKS